MTAALAEACKLMTAASSRPARNKTVAQNGDVTKKHDIGTDSDPESVQESVKDEVDSQAELTNDDLDEVDDDDDRDDDSECNEEADEMYAEHGWNSDTSVLSPPPSSDGDAL